KFLRKVRAADDVDGAVAVDVYGQVAEIIYVIFGIADGAEVMLGPVRALVPVLAGNNVELAVAIEIGDRTGLIGAQIQRVLFKRDVGRTADAPRDRGGRGQAQNNRNTVPSHADDSTALLVGRTPPSATDPLVRLYEAGVGVGRGPWGRYVAA